MGFLSANNGVHWPSLSDMSDQSAEPTAKVTLEIYSDVVCPWCYIGKRRFETAMDRLTSDERERMTVIWRPFQLDPSAPVGPGRPAVDGYAKKFGGVEKATEIIDSMTNTAAGVGLGMRFDIAKRANTFEAHRLLWWAYETAGVAAQWELKERLLAAYFVQGREVGVIEELAAIAGEAGLDRDAALAFLQSAAGVSETKLELEEGREIGVTAVPTFVVNHQWGVPGAQDPEVLERMLRRLLAEAA